MAKMSYITFFFTFGSLEGLSQKTICESNEFGNYFDDKRRKLGDLQVHRSAAGSFFLTTVSKTFCLPIFSSTLFMFTGKR